MADPWKRRVEIGPHVLYEGDCLEVLPTLGKVDAVVTDPPYNFSTASSGNKLQFWADAVNAAYWFSEVLRQCSARLHGRGFIWQFLNWKTFIPAQKACWEAGMKFESLLVWDKQWIGPGGSVGLRPSYELIALMACGDVALPNRGLPDIWRHQWASARPNGHPAEKPVGLLCQMVKETPGECFADPFMGSGTTGVACVREGRRFIGIELDPGYFDIACERIRREMAQPRFDLTPPPKPEQLSLPK